MQDKIYDVVIIGGGPAGLAAALYSSRIDLKTVILEGNAPGGKLLNTHAVDNYVGFGKKTGFEIAMDFKKHALEFGAELISENAKEIIDIKKDIKIIKTSSGNFIKTKSIIIATGLKPKKLNVPGFDEYFGKGLSTCLVCDGGFHKNKDILVIGGGLSAVEESIYIKDIVSKIYIINSYPSFNVPDNILDKILNDNKFEISHSTNVVEFKGDGKRLTSVLVQDKNKNIREINISGAFVYAGWNPVTNFIKDTEILNKSNFVITNNLQETSIPGVFAAGDVVPKQFKQVGIATSEGSIAALSAKKYLSNK